jgi:branched-subunit amino acid aminotransferase/4-amino-4-deoxychorismate lyase
MAMMIWSAGRFIPETEPLVGPSDRALEHGVGLFETLRTWGGRPVLLPRHLARLRQSAKALGLQIDPADLPDEQAILNLIDAHQISGEAVVRITVAGGELGGNARVWMRTFPAPASFRGAGAILVLDGYGLNWYDSLARHKTLNYWSKRRAYERAREQGADEALQGTPDGRIWEATRMNLFLVRDHELWTPGLDGPVLPGIMRGLVIECARKFGLEVSEADMRASDVDQADEVFLTNAVRGIVPVCETPGGPIASPGVLTRRLNREVRRWLSGGNGEESA